MKTKHFTKKLELTKKTVADLNGKEMNAVNGGGVYTLAYTNCYMCMKTMATDCCY